MSAGWIAVMVTPRGALLDGHNAIVLNQEVFPTREAAERRAEAQRKVEALFRKEVNVAVFELPEPQ